MANTNLKIFCKEKSVTAEAKNIIEKAQAELKKPAEQKMQEVKGEIANFGK